MNALTAIVKDMKELAKLIDYAATKSGSQQTRIAQLKLDDAPKTGAELDDELPELTEGVK